MSDGGKAGTWHITERGTQSEVFKGRVSPQSDCLLRFGCPGPFLAFLESELGIWMSSLFGELRSDHEWPDESQKAGSEVEMALGMKQAPSHPL